MTAFNLGLENTTEHLGVEFCLANELHHFVVAHDLVANVLFFRLGIVRVSNAQGATSLIRGHLLDNFFDGLLWNPGSKLGSNDTSSLWDCLVFLGPLHTESLLHRIRQLFVADDVDLGHRKNKHEEAK